MGKTDRLKSKNEDNIWQQIRIEGIRDDELEDGGVQCKRKREEESWRKRSDEGGREGGMAT